MTLKPPLMMPAAPEPATALPMMNHVDVRAVAHTTDPAGLGLAKETKNNKNAFVAYREVVPHR